VLWFSVMEEPPHWRQGAELARNVICECVTAGMEYARRYDTKSGETTSTTIPFQDKFPRPFGALASVLVLRWCAAPAVT